MKIRRRAPFHAAKDAAPTALRQPSEEAVSEAASRRQERAAIRRRLQRAVGVGSESLSTEEIMRLTRGED